MRGCRSSWRQVSRGVFSCAVRGHATPESLRSAFWLFMLALACSPGAGDLIGKKNSSRALALLSVTSRSWPISKPIATKCKEFRPKHGRIPPYQVGPHHGFGFRLCSRRFATDCCQKRGVFVESITRRHCRWYTIPYACRLRSHQKRELS